MKGIALDVRKLWERKTHVTTITSDNRNNNEEELWYFTQHFIICNSATLLRWRLKYNSTKTALLDRPHQHPASASPSMAVVLWWGTAGAAKHHYDCHGVLSAGTAVLMMCRNASGDDIGWVGVARCGFASWTVGGSEPLKGSMYSFAKYSFSSSIRERWVLFLRAIRFISLCFVYYFWSDGRFGSCFLRLVCFFFSFVFVYLSSKVFC